MKQKRIRARSILLEMHEKWPMCEIESFEMLKEPKVFRTFSHGFTIDKTILDCIIGQSLVDWLIVVWHVTLFARVAAA